MSNDRRKNLTHILESAAIVLVLFDVALYVAVVRPMGNLAKDKFERSEQARLKIQNEKEKVSRLEWYKSALPGTKKDIDDFFSNEVKSRRKSFSRSTRMARGLAEHAGLKLTSISYHLESLRDQPLDLMDISMSVEGPFPSLLNFAHALETTSGDFIVLRDFNFDAAEGKDLSLRLSAELYLTP
jgi:hypothetical protein